DGTDPLANFLLRSRRGHCVHFAGAAALMCQRLGLTARVAVGYRASEFNRLTGQYVVRQSDAHAWIEVLTTTGWQTFDPTPPNDEDAGGTGAFASAYAGAEHAVDYVRWAYATYVAGFSADQQRAIAGGGQQWMEAALARSRSVFNTIAGGDTAEAEEAPSSGAARFSTYAVAAGGAGGVAWLLWRIARQRGRLAKKKATASDAVAGANGTAGGGVDVPFYDELARVLERHAVTAGPRPPHLTPLEFYGRLPLPDAAATVVRRLTMLFYRVRFGNGRLTAARQARLANTVEQLDRALATPAPGAAAPAGADGQLPSPA
ncbi:MAG TPA: transglutaminase domain-containing protein, partial [Tepidisphaeraceae bacterium]|nr:transglutaminase domain-containing protein [Tepidisphaeraceae bacterium]